MRPLDFYNLGLNLAGQASTDAEYRNVIGRLYYGLHHEACCRYFREHPSAPAIGSGSRHRQLIQRYRRLGDGGARRVQNLLRQLSQMRNISDYELTNSFRYRRRMQSPASLMTIAVSVAAQLLAELESFSPGEAADGCPCMVQR